MALLRERHYKNSNNNKMNVGHQHKNYIDQLRRYDMQGERLSVLESQIRALHADEHGRDGAK